MINVGKIIEVNNEAILVAASENVGKLSPDKTFIGEVGSYVMVNNSGRIIVLEITGSKNVDGKNYLNLGPIGEIINNEFTYGITKLPYLFSSVFLDSAVLKILYEANGKRLKIGVGLTTNIDISVDINKFFGAHFAIFGNSGAGKSNTVARIIQNIFEQKAYGAKIVIIDSNGEYHQAFSKISNGLKAETFTADYRDDRYEHLQIPVWALTGDDWGVLLNATERNQIPVLRRAIDIADVFFSEETNTGRVKNHILASTIMGIVNSSDNSPSKIDKLTAILTKFKTPELNLDKEITSTIGMPQTIAICIKNDNGQLKDVAALQNYCERLQMPNIASLLSIRRGTKFGLEDFKAALELATLYEGSASSTRIQEYTSTLSTRLEAVIEDPNGKVFQKTDFKSADDYVKYLLNGRQILNIDLGTVADYTGEVIAKVIGRVLLDYQRRRPKGEMPINIILEEAHRYVKEANDSVLGYNIFERIAKEGRKYGIILGLSSQRPSELSKSIVSQCANFIIHRIQNPDDLDYVAKMLPNANMLESLTYLKTGTGLVCGTAINLPTITKFDIASPTTDGQSANIYGKWFAR